MVVVWALGCGHYMCYDRVLSATASVAVRQCVYLCLPFLVSTPCGCVAVLGRGAPAGTRDFLMG